MKKGFTLAEVLITLSVIGVVAALTLPSLMANIQEKTWEAQRKALHARMAQALGQIKSFTYYPLSDGTPDPFLIDGLSKVLKINTICNHYDLTPCGFSTTLIDFNGSTMTLPDTSNDLMSNFSPEINDNVENKKEYLRGALVAGFTTVNGDSVLLYQNPNCGDKLDTAGGDTSNIATKMCVNFIYDTNGLKGPNQIGKDMGIITSFYKKDPIVVSPQIIESASTGGSASSIATATSECEKLDGRVPNVEEMMALVLNEKLYNTSSKGAYWTSTRQTVGKSYIVSGKAVSTTSTDSASSSLNYICVEK